MSQSQGRKDRRQAKRAAGIPPKSRQAPKPIQELVEEARQQGIRESRKLVLDHLQAAYMTKLRHPKDPEGRAILKVARELAEMLATQELPNKP